MVKSTEGRITSAKDLFSFDRRTVATVLVTKIAILAFGALTYQLFTSTSLDSAYQFLEIWTRWDANHYLNIAQNGYTAEGENRFFIVYFPLYPALIAAVAVLLRYELVSAFFVTAVASIWLGAAFKALVRIDHGETVSRHAVLFMFLFPTAYFLHVPYNESLFLALCVTAFLAARKEYWAVAGILGILACLTRINGVILVPALALEVWSRYRDRKKIDPKWIWAAVPGLGFVGYLLLNYVVTGNAFMFLVHQREHWHKYMRFPWEGIYETWKSMSNPKVVDAIMHGFFEMLFVLIGLAAIIAGWRWMRASYRVWLVANWLIFVSTSFILSVPRYTLLLFPVFILMSLAAARSWTVKVLFLTCSVMLLALFSIQFSRGWWAF